MYTAVSVCTCTGVSVEQLEDLRQWGRPTTNETNDSTRKKPASMYFLRFASLRQRSTLLPLADWLLSWKGAGKGHGITSRPLLMPDSYFSSRVSSLHAPTFLAHLRSSCPVSPVLRRLVHPAGAPRSDPCWSGLPALAGSPTCASRIRRRLRRCGGLGTEDWRWIARFAVLGLTRARGDQRRGEAWTGGVATSMRCFGGGAAVRFSQ
jgi:hypothetical protein